jgi:polysaccharide biosynthesis protein PslH
VVAIKIPYPVTSGGLIAIYEPIRHLAIRGHDITLLAFDSRPINEWAPITQYCRVIPIPHNTITRTGPAVLNLFHTIPYIVTKYKSKALADELLRLITEETFDLVQFEILYMGHYASIPKTKGIPALLRQQNVETIVWERLAERGRGLISLYSKIQALKMRQYEKLICEQVDACLAITQVDSQTLRRMSSQISTFVVPVGVDLDVYSPTNEVEKPFNLVYVGSMDYYPNEDAILWFTTKILPMIKAQIPGTKLFIVGRNPSNKVRKLCNNDIIVTGTVEDVQAFIQQASVFLVPLRIGSGIRIKILQAMAMGKAIVSTSVGAQGIALTSGQNIVISDTPKEFSESVIHLLQEPEIRLLLGRNARQFVEKYYRWETIIDDLEKIYHLFVDSSL